jgi:hypothetical protein
MNKSQAEIVAITRAMRDGSGNMPPLPGIFPDYLAPIVRTGPDGVADCTGRGRPAAPAAAAGRGARDRRHG